MAYIDNELFLLKDESAGATVTSAAFDLGNKGAFAHPLYKKALPLIPPLHEDNSLMEKRSRQYWTSTALTMIVLPRKPI